MTKLDYCNIEKAPGRCGGQATVAGTRIRVCTIGVCYRQGMTVEEIVQHYPIYVRLRCMMHWHRLTTIAWPFDSLASDEEVIMTRHQQPVATLVGQPRRLCQPRQPGNCQGMLTIVADDDEHLQDFKDYMS